jgi:hypothetical protein
MCYHFTAVVEEAGAEILVTVPKAKTGQHLLGNNRIVEAKER